MCFSLSINTTVSLSVFLCLSTCLPVYLYPAFVFLSVYWFVYLSIGLFFCLLVCLSVYWSVFLSISLSLCLLVCLSVYWMSVFLSISLSFCRLASLSLYFWLPGPPDTPVQSFLSCPSPRSTISSVVHPQNPWVSISTFFNPKKKKFRRGILLGNNKL